MNSLEDNHEDILAKGMRGLAIGKTDMANRIDLDKSRVDAVLGGEVDDEAVKAMAEVLGLDASKLIALSRKAWLPAPREIDSLEQFNLPFGNMRVNAYLIWDESSGKAWAFDTGPQAAPILESLDNKGLFLDGIFLTHTHPDHIACLDELRQGAGNPPVFVHELEGIADSNLIEEGFECTCGNLSIKALHTHGHSVGGTTFLVGGLLHPIAIVGDALFAGSMGGGMVSYGHALRNNREKIMVLPDQTIVCPGHGPVTTIREEKAHNPFFPEFASV
jgi:hydroxyacylglutathione hydrolase